jgi:hypothetical protein
MRGKRCPWPVVWGSLCTAVVVAILCGLLPRHAAADPPPEPKPLRDRIVERFRFRLDDEIASGPDRVTFDANELDPLQWTRFEEKDAYLLGGTAHREAVALLDEFLTRQGEKSVSDPLDRAFLQHDLWAAFDWATNPYWDRPGRKQYPRERRELYVRLAAVMGRLALSDAQVGKLPDNYAAAVAAKKYPPRFDPEHKGQAFLPADLWDPEGPWVLLREWATNPLVVRHVAFNEGRSAFAAFLRLPGGRDETVKYLKELREWKPKDGKGEPPQVPAETQVALARRMLLVNDAGEVVPTRLTETVQVRVLHDPTQKYGDVQTFLEYRLRRPDLLAGKDGGLSAVGKDEREREDLLFLQRWATHDPEKRVPILQSCGGCHREPGIHSVNSYTGFCDNVGPLRGARSLVEGTLQDQEEATITWKHNQYSWGLLTGLREGRSHD